MNINFSQWIILLLIAIVILSVNINPEKKMSCTEGAACGTEGTCHANLCTWDKTKYYSKIQGKIINTGNMQVNNLELKDTWILQDLGGGFINYLYYSDATGKTNQIAIQGDYGMPPPSKNLIEFVVIEGDSTPYSLYILESFAQKSIANLLPNEYTSFIQFKKVYLLGGDSFQHFITNSNQWVSS